MMDDVNKRRKDRQTSRIPNSLRELWNFRLNLFIKEIGKYSRLIINDHFSVIILVLLAFSGLYYQELLASLDGSQSTYVIFLIELLVFILFILTTNLGQPIWLTEEADQAYLFSLGRQWFDYWKSSSLISIPIPLIITGLVSGLVFPLLRKIGVWSQMYFPFELTSVLFLHFLSMLTYLFRARAESIFTKGRVFLLNILGLAFLLFVREPINLILFTLLIFLYLGFFFYSYRNWANQVIRFDYVVEQEKERKSSFYRWISIFADVPQIKPTIHRRKFLDSLLSFLDKYNRDPYSYHLSRLLLRHPIYSGIWLKVLFFVGFLMIWLSNPIFLLILGIVGHLMTLVQLIPLLTYHEKQTMIRVYPMDSNYLKGFSFSLRVILYIQSLIYAFASRKIFLFLPWILVTEIFLRFYLPWRHKSLMNH